MSAIAGIYQMNKEPINTDHYKRIMDSLLHFPADDTQVWIKDEVFLGCHAQWITPESVDEMLPFYDVEQGMVITSDAIIDNRIELFEKLQISENKRKTIPDSYLILQAYKKWGDDCPEYLVGDFAFVIWDEKRQKLFGARDFSGGRTLYYNSDLTQFTFCTTIKPLLSLPYISSVLNQEWIAEFLVIAGMVDVADTSITPYKEIKQLPPAHSITVQNGKVSLKQYKYLKWESSLQNLSNNEYIEAFQEVFQQAVSSRIRTYKTVGAQLSGGLDSGSIVSFAARELKKQNKQLHTFSYIPPSDFTDYTPKHLVANEKPYIKSTVNYIGGLKDHYFDFEGRDSYSEIDSVMSHMETPYKFYVNSFWLKGMFEQANKMDIGILLNGGRGNLSISWGDAFPFYAQLLKRFKWVRLLSEVKSFSNNVGSGRKTILSSVLNQAFPILQRNSNLSTTHTPLINQEFANRTRVYDKLRNLYEIDKTGQSLIKDSVALRKQHFEQLFQWNASNSLAAKLSLHYSVWKRDPTNDLRVIRFCMSIPHEQYVQNGLNRALIRRATENYLPDNVRLNMRVRGVQGVDWVHRIIPKWNDFTSEVVTMCNDKTFMEIVNEEKLLDAKECLNDPVRPQHAYSSHLKVLMDSLVLFRFIKNEGR
ncbi:asparagine synthase-related protein [Metabacillus litoralis]|uniref:asparagine synthase-related protein n=1 Tax=Metabacillus litoralis TaxID=152268 RepID=UPI00203FFCE4|nr:asparagine synthase-related protein [Metabacillus litoralis]MCM3412444.1 asparagine synthase-related protein [Metabacillus litoralis]